MAKFDQEKAAKVFYAGFDGKQEAIIDGWIFTLAWYNESGYWLDWKKFGFDKYNRRGRMVIDGPKGDPSWQQVAEAVNEVI